MTYYRYFTILFAVLLVGSSISCRKDKDQDTNLILANLKDEFQVSLIEQLSPNGNQLVMEIATIEPVNCENTVLNYSLEQSNAKVIVAINDLDIPMDPDCILNPEILTTSVPMGLYPSGPTDIEINLRESVQNDGQLTHESDHYRLSMRTQYGIDIPQPKLYKIKSGVIWGYIGYRTADSPIVGHFFDEMANHTEAGDFESGYYGHFSLDKDANQPVEFDDNHELPFVRRFLFELTSDTDALEAMLTQFRLDYGNEIELEIRTWEGGIL